MARPKKNAGLRRHRREVFIWRCGQMGNDSLVNRRAECLLTPITRHPGDFVSACYCFSSKKVSARRRRRHLLRPGGRLRVVFLPKIGGGGNDIEAATFLARRP